MGNRIISQAGAKGAGVIDKIATDGGVGSGGANHHYLIVHRQDKAYPKVHKINFQVGPICSDGIRNGITNEELLLIVADRLKCFQAGPYPCEHNAVALKAITLAVRALNDRTEDRIKRGVEGLELP
jgi:hypothetical protein